MRYNGDMDVFLDAGYMAGAACLAKDRRARCRELGRVDKSAEKTKEKLDALELLGAAGEIRTGASGPAGPTSFSRRKRPST